MWNRRRLLFQPGSKFLVLARKGTGPVTPFKRQVTSDKKYLDLNFKGTSINTLSLRERERESKDTLLILISPRPRIESGAGSNLLPEGPRCPLVG